jgi:hypothetical protein
VAVLAVCFENVLSNTKPNMPPSPALMLWVPMDTLSASHLPCHFIGMKPLLASWSCAVLASFLKRLVFPSGTVACVVEFGSAASSAEVRFVPPEPGCLTMPKFLARG